MLHSVRNLHTLNIKQPVMPLRSTSLYARMHKGVCTWVLIGNWHPTTQVPMYMVQPVPTVCKTIHCISRARWGGGAQALHNCKAHASKVPFALEPPPADAPALCMQQHKWGPSIMYECQEPATSQCQMLARKGPRQIHMCTHVQALRVAAHTDTHKVHHTWGCFATTATSGKSSKHIAMHVRMACYPSRWRGA